jgi:hypothetical protein
MKLPPLFTQAVLSFGFVALGACGSSDSKLGVSPANAGSGGSTVEVTAAGGAGAGGGTSNVGSGGSTLGFTTAGSAGATGTARDGGASPVDSGVSPSNTVSVPILSGLTSAGRLVYVAGRLYFVEAGPPTTYIRSIAPDGTDAKLVYTVAGGVQKFSTDGTYVLYNLIQGALYGVKLPNDPPVKLDTGGIEGEFSFLGNYAYYASLQTGLNRPINAINLTALTNLWAISSDAKYAPISADYAIGGGRIFYISTGTTPAKNEIRSVPAPSGANSLFLEATEPRYPVADDTTLFYFSGNTATSLVSAPLAGGAAQTIVPVVSLAPKLRPMLDSTHIYWATYSGVFRAPRSGGAEALFIAGSVASFALGDSGVYWTDFTGDKIYLADK